MANTNELRTPALPLAGNYTIFLYDGGNVASAYRVVLECITGPCVVVQIPDLSGYLTLRGSTAGESVGGYRNTRSWGDQTTTTDQNGYYQFLKAPGGNFTVYAPISGSVNAASADSVQEAQTSEESRQQWLILALTSKCRVVPLQPESGWGGEDVLAPAAKAPLSPLYKHYCSTAEEAAEKVRNAWASRTKVRSA